MRGFEGFGDLLGDRQRVIDWDRPLRDAVGDKIGSSGWIRTPFANAPGAGQQPSG